MLDVEKSESSFFLFRRIVSGCVNKFGIWKSEAFFHLH